MSQVHLRPATSDDFAFFYSATLQSHYYSSHTNRYIPPTTYYPEHKKILERLLTRPAVELTVACLEEDPGVIIGFALTEGPVIHYVYVKRAFRGFGVARRLVADVFAQLGPVTASHWTEDASEVLRERRVHVTFNPYLLGDFVALQRAG